MTMAGSLLFTASGCDFYFTGQDDDDPCVVGDERAPESAIGVRDPYTGQCELVGGEPCDDRCGPCPQPATDVDPDVSWGACYSECTGLDEQTCLATPACRGSYYVVDATTDLPRPPIPDAPGRDVFFECWATDRQGPIQGGGCYELDAWQCSLHDDCVAIHRADCEGAPDQASCGVDNFVRCAPEPQEPIACYSDDECADGYWCKREGECLPPPGCDDSEACPAVCYGRCVPDDTMPPPPPPPACADIIDEMTCIFRDDCAPYYEGVDCTCSPEGCTCDDWVFTSCDVIRPVPF